MIILDLNQVMLASMFVQIGNAKNAEVDVGLIRHMALNSIRAYLKKFKNEYGELIIACDDKSYWRRDVFPFYKANRKKSRDKSTLDWPVIFEALHAIRDELKEYFTYRTIQVDGAEADDVIATLCHEYGMNMGQKILIISSDKDFVQLHDYPAVVQFDPIRKKWVRHGNPDQYRREHILRGDVGDGVPNFLSPDNVLVTPGARQKPISTEKLEKIWMVQEPEEFCTPEMLRGYMRNKQLIDMNEIPQDLRDKIMASYHEQANKPYKDLFNYFFKFKLKNLTESIGDF